MSDAGEGAIAAGPRGVWSSVNLLAAFSAVDRRCRTVSASAREFVARAALARAMGDETSALKDLRVALEHDPNHVEANVGVLRWGNAQERFAAASRLIAGECRNVGVLREAIAVQLAERRGIVHRLRPSGDGVVGWLAWSGQESLPLRLDDSEGQWTVDVAPDISHALCGDGWGIVDIEVGRVVKLSSGLDGELIFRRAEPRVFFDQRRALQFPMSRLTVIVPIFDGFEATRVCLESLFAQQQMVFSTILVDDASPDPRLSALAVAAALRPGVTLLRNSVNSGFAGSVNRALAICGDHDVLLLNADTILPTLAVSRLQRLAASDPSLGTATPFSNNGQLTSFPRPLVVNRLPSPAEVETISEIAWAVNGATVVDVPTGIGFCLYITRACLESVGALPERYGRGYYEDAEFCMMARQHGFRNVCATGVYVGHAGSLSFKSEKPALASRNLAILEERFPGQQRQFLAYVHADPLRRARAAIEERHAPDDDCTLVVASEGRSSWQAWRRARDLEARGIAAIVLTVSAGGSRVELQRAQKGLPASMNFPLDEAGGVRLTTYLRKLTVRAVEMFDAARTPDPVVNALLGLGAPVDLFCVDLSATPGILDAPRSGACATPSELAVCVPCAAECIPTVEDEQRRARVARVFDVARVVASVDRMGAALAKRAFPAKAQPMEVESEPMSARPGRIDRGVPPVLGVLAPVASVECDRLLARLSRELASRRNKIAIVVLGACFNEADLSCAGSTVVVGCADAEEWERLARVYGVARLALFDRTSLFGPLDWLARRIAAPKAYFDWSFGALEATPGDLVLDPGVCDEKAATAVANWLESG